jgi:zinc protease
MNYKAIGLKIFQGITSLKKAGADIWSGNIKAGPMLAVSILMGLVMFSCVAKQPANLSANLSGKGILATIIFPTSIFPYSLLPESGIENDPALAHGILPNGFQYVLMENSTPKDQVSVHLNVFAGSVHETDEEQGIAHYLEHMVFNGSEHFKPGELIEYFQSIGMDFGADANASTSFFKTVYDLTLPKGNKKYLEDAFLVIKDYAGGALLLEEEVERERGIILAEKRERDSVSYRTFKRELAFELPGSLLNKRFAIGIDPVLETTDRKLLKGFYDRCYRPDNMALVVVGDMDIKEVQELIREKFSRMQPRTTLSGKHVDISWKPHKGTSIFYHYEPEAGNTEITIERLSHTAFGPQTLEKLKETLLKDLGDSIFQNRLSQMIGKESVGFSTASVYSGTFLQNISMAAVKASCEPDKWENSLDQLEKSLRQALEYGFSPLEFTRVKADFISRLDADLAQAETRKTSALAQSILRAINQKKLFLSPLQEQKLLKPYLLGLTLEKVNQAFRSSWADDHRLVLVSGNAKIAENQIAAKEQIFDLYNKSSAQAVGKFERFKAKIFPYLDLPESRGKIQAKKENVKGLGIIQVELQNNIKLNLKPTDFKKGEFLIKVVFGKGKASEPESLPGLSALAEATIRESGFASMDTDQIEDALAGKDVSMGFSINDNYFELTGSGDPNESELIFQLIYTYFKDPGFRSQGLALAKTHYGQMYEALKRTPDGIMSIQGNSFLAKGDPRFGLLSLEKIDRISLEDIEAWLKPRFETAPMEVSIVGDFDHDTMIKHAITYLGALETRENPSKSAMEAKEVVFPKGEKLVLNLDTKIDKGMVRIAFLTDDFWDINQTRKLSMLARVFSERLRKTIREELGASYSPYVYNNPSLVHDRYGIMHVVVNVLPENSDIVYEQIEKIVKALAREGVNKKELELVKKPILNHLIVMRQNNNYWLNSVMANSFRHPERLDWANHLMSTYSSISNEDLSVLAKQYLKMDESALIIIHPKE